MFTNMPLEFLDKDKGLREIMRIATVGGFKGVDLDIEKITRLSEQHSSKYVKGMLDSFGITAGTWVIPLEMDSENQSFNGALPTIEKYAKTAGEISAQRAIISLKNDYYQKMDFFAERLKIIAEILEKYGCSIGLETEDCPQETNYFDCLKQLLELCDKARAKNAGIIINARRWHLSGAEEKKLKSAVAKLIVCVRIADIPSGNRRGKMLPGETGIVNLQAFLRTLSDAGYDGPVTPEMPDRNLSTMPEEIAVRLLGGALSKVMNKTFSEI